MYTLITIFYASLLGIIAMILLKRREVRTGRASVVSRAGAGTDHVFQALFARAQRIMSYMNKHTFAALAHLAAFYVLKQARAIYIEVKHKFISTSHGKKLIDAVRGRGEVSDQGASFYLRRIATKENK